MKVESTRRNRRIVFSTFILSSLILAVATYLFVTVMIPLYGLDPSQIRMILIRLLPIVTGFLLVASALAIHPPTLDTRGENEDELERDPLTAPLYVLPDEESNMSLGPILEPVGPSQKQQRIVENNLDKVDRTPVNTLDEVTAPPVILDTNQIFDFPRGEQEGLSEPVPEPEASPENQVSETRTEEAVETVASSPLDRQVLFAAYPFPIEPDSSIAELLEPIPESVPVDDDQNLSLYLQIDDTFDDRLSEEIEYAKAIGYPLSLAYLTCDGDEQMEDLTGSLVSLDGIVYHEGQTLRIILPFLSFDQCREVFSSVLSRVRKQYPEHRLSCGYSTFSLESQRTTPLTEQVETALTLATEHGSYAVIGYDSIIEEE